MGFPLHFALHVLKDMHRNIFAHGHLTRKVQVLAMEFQKTSEVGHASLPDKKKPTFSSLVGQRM